MWNWKIILPTTLFCYIIIIWRVLNISMFDETKARDFYHGDAYSDKNSYSTAIYMNDFGFTKSKLLPVWNYYQKSDSSSAAVYTHYPALPDVLTAVYAKLYHSTHESVVRIIPVVLSMVFILILGYVIQLYTQNKTNSSIALCILLLSNYFIFWADNLHKHQYEEMLKWLYIGLLYIFYNAPKKQNWLILVLALIFIVVSNISFEPIPYLAIVTIGFALIYKKTIFTIETFALGFSAVIGVALHLYQNYLFLGDWVSVIHDMTDAAKLRAGGTDNIQNELGKPLNWLDYVNIPNLILMRLERVFLIPGPIFVFLLYLVLNKKNKITPTIKKIIITLLIANLCWPILMTQHFTVHCFTIRHWGILYGLVIALSIPEYKSMYTKLKAEKSNWLYLHYAAWVYILVMAGTQHFWDYWRYGFSDFTLINS